MSSDKSLEELLALLEKNKDVVGNEIEQFIRDNNIVASKKPTKNYIIYWVYLTWKLRGGGGFPIPRAKFFKLFKKYFEPASRDKFRRYYVTSSAFTLHPDEIDLAKRECGREKTWLTLQRNQKKYDRTGARERMLKYHANKRAKRNGTKPPPQD